MADASRAPIDPLAAPAARDDERERFLELVRRAPYAFSFFQVLRRLQHLAADRPLLGDSDRPRSEPIRLGQMPSLGFAPSELAEVQSATELRPARLMVHFFGMLGPNGPLPLHLTEYTRDRLQNADDPTMSRFLDIFHHRMLLFMFRAWAAAEPTVAHDRRGDRFETYVGATFGQGLASLRDRDAFPDAAKLFYAGRFAAQGRNADGLAAVVGDFFGVPARVESFMRDLLELPDASRWRLGARGAGSARLGLSSSLGARVVTRQSKFRIALGPLDRAQFQRFLPGGAGLPKLEALVRNYVGDELRWDLKLFLAAQVDEPWLLGNAGLGWTTWAGLPRGASRRADLVLDPQRPTT